VGLIHFITSFFEKRGSLYNNSLLRREEGREKREILILPPISSLVPERKEK